MIAGLLLITLTLSCSEEKSKSHLNESYGEWRKDDNSLGWIPTKVVSQEGQRNYTLEKRIKQNIKSASFYQMQQQGLFNQYLLDQPAEQLPWSTGYFPSWFNGLAGRWSESGLTEYFGYKIQTREKILKKLNNQNRGVQGSFEWLYKMSPMEKYDLAVGDYNFRATRRETALRGQKDIFMAMWSGYCNGVSIASTLLEEPFRMVRVVNKDGYSVFFHPYDIKGLLGLAYYRVDYSNYARLGSRCKEYPKNSKVFSTIVNKEAEIEKEEKELYRKDNKKCRGVNPATFVLALQNRLGIAKQTFVIEKMLDKTVSNHPIGEAKVDIIKPPYTPSRSQRKYTAPGTTSIVEVKISLWLGSTALDDDDAVNEILSFSQGLYKKVGFKMEDEDSPRTYFATLELNNNGKIIGGEWGIRSKYGSYTHPTSAPDFAWFGMKPLLIDFGQTKRLIGLKGKALKNALKFNKKVRCKKQRGDKCDSLSANPRVKWSILKQIYDLSILPAHSSPEVPTLYL